MNDLRLMKREEVLTRTKSLIATERKGHADFLTYLAEVDFRKLYLPEYSSLFSFCTRALGLSEASASKRIQVARCAVKFPEILGQIARNELTLSNASLLAPNLTETNRITLISEALGKPKREVEKLVVTHFPKPDIAESVRKLSVRTFPGERAEQVVPLTAARTKFEFSGDEEIVGMYRLLQDRLRRKYPQGRIEDIVRDSFRLLVEKTDPAREPSRRVGPIAAKHTRRPPASVNRRVWQKDGERCTFLSSQGTRCEATAFLELDHVIPWSLGGSSRDPENLTIRCRAHNAWRGGARPKVLDDSRPGG